MPDEVTEADPVEAAVAEVQAENGTSESDDAAGKLAALATAPEGETAKPEDAEKPEGEDAAEEEHDTELPHGVVKRIGKEVAKRKAAEEETARLKAELAKKPEFDAELLNAVDGERLVQYGMKTGVATADDLKIMTASKDAAMAVGWLEANPDAALKHLANQNPDASESKLGILYSQWLSKSTRSLNAAENAARGVRERIVQQIGKKQTAATVSPAARPATALAAKPKAAPVAVATGGSTTGRLPGANRARGINAIFEANKGQGEDAAAEAALQSLVGA